MWLRKFLLGPQNGMGLLQGCRSHTCGAYLFVRGWGLHHRASTLREFCLLTWLDDIVLFSRFGDEKKKSCVKVPLTLLLGTKCKANFVGEKIFKNIKIIQMTNFMSFFYLIFLLNETHFNTILTTTYTVLVNIYPKKKKKRESFL